MTARDVLAAVGGVAALVSIFAMMFDYKLLMAASLGVCGGAYILAPLVEDASDD